MRVVLVSLAVSLAIAAPAWAQTEVNETRPLAADGTVEISNIAGSVHVIGWSSDQVEITGVLGREVEELQIEGDMGHLEIEVEVPRSSEDIDADLTIRVPASANVEVDTVSASIVVEGVGGAVELESVSGKVSVTAEPRELVVETVSGNIDLSSTPGRTELASVSGSIEVGNAVGELEAESVSGDIKIQGGLLEAGSFETVSGNISFAAEMAIRGEFEFESMSGQVVLKVSPGVSADFDVSTFSGSIENAIGPEAQRSSKYTPEKELRFSSGSGGARVSISSFSGAVKIVTK
jgi:DUF4097 and DUF4098 domain-containing protein YvlB